MRMLRWRQSLKPMPLCFYEHPSLRTPAAPVGEITPAVTELAERMVVTMEQEDGIGLAAPQVGTAQRLITLDIPRERHEAFSPNETPGEVQLLPLMPLTLVDPVLRNHSEQTCEYSEGCLSIPGVCAPVSRPEFVDLQARTITGKPLQARCGGLLARALQHEVDHLDGVLFIDYLDDETLTRLKTPLARLKARTERDLKRQR